LLAQRDSYIKKGDCAFGDEALKRIEAGTPPAPEHGHHLEQELLFLASHGLLHLLGWDHPDDSSLAAMLARQLKLLESTGSQAERR
jgi:probable rRNA maturation factor